MGELSFQSQLESPGNTAAAVANKGEASIHRQLPLRRFEPHKDDRCLSVTFEELLGETRSRFQGARLCTSRERASRETASAVNQLFFNLPTPGTASFITLKLTDFY